MEGKQVFYVKLSWGWVGIFFLSLCFRKTPCDKMCHSRHIFPDSFFSKELISVATASIPTTQGTLFVKKSHPLFSGWDVFYEMVGRVGIEPTKAKPKDLQSSPFDHSGTDPKRKKVHSFKFKRRDFHLLTIH